MAAFGPRCGFCGEEIRAMVSRHSGVVCYECGVMYYEHEGGWWLDRVLDGDRWRQYPRDCLVVVRRFSEDVL
jgi:hypothetical protein